MNADIKIESFNFLSHNENNQDSIFREIIYENINQNITLHSTGEERYFKNNDENLLNNKRKRGPKGCRENGIIHDKFSADNLRRECKHLVIESVMKFINQRIYNAYDGNIGDGILKKELVKLEQSQKMNSSVEFNKEFLNKTLKEILSQNITKRIKKYEQEHNKKLINNLLEEKKEEFEKLFNLTFIECLNHFSGNKLIDELNGLTLFSELKDQILTKYEKDGESYFKNLEKFFKEFEQRINNAKPRQKKS